MTSEPRLWPSAGSPLPPDLAAELGAVAATPRRDGRVLSAWVDPGPNFERTITISDERDLDGSFDITICQRYRPRDPMVCVVAADVRHERVPDDLRIAVETARERDPYRVHWLFSCRPAEPRWSVRFSMACPDVARAAMRTASARACANAEPHYLYNDREQLVCANNPPAEGRFFSVTPERRWSAHHGDSTQPLAGQPGMVALGFCPPSSAALSAAARGGVARRPEQRVSPAEPAPPARRGR